MNKFWVIALDVYKKNIKSISFLIMIGSIHCNGRVLSN